jgi:HD-GYP domain-containing protein (c-di-GMP phosphodiesterase class II)
VSSRGREVNDFCLERIIDLSERREIVAAEDIVDDRGVKLWAKGQKVSRSLQEKLLRHKLAHPLETALTVDGGVISEQVVASCFQLIEEDEPLKRISGTTAARVLLESFRQTPTPGPLKLLLTTAKDTGMEAFEHSIYCVAVSAGIAARLNLSDHDAQQLLFAALVHDIGELYINPDYVRGSMRLAPSKWKHVAAHPRIGQILIEDLTTLPAAIGVAVAEHHERLDGSGYPAQHAGTAISRSGRLLAVADTAAAIIGQKKGQTAGRLALALRIVPGEYDRATCHVLTEVLEDIAVRGIADADGRCLQHLGEVVERLNRSTELATELIDKAPSKFVAETARYVLDGLNVLSKSLSATGAVEALLLEEIAEDETIIAEIFLVSREVDWRLRNLARNIYCRVDLANNAMHLPDMNELIEALDSPSHDEAQ